MYGTTSDEGSSEVLISTRLDPAGSGVLTVTFERPTVYNAMSSALCRAVATTLRQVGDEVKVVVLRGAGGNFSVGGDIDEVQRLRAAGESQLAGLFEAFGDMLAAVEECAVPVVAAVEGYALAGGFELLQVCDVVLVSDTAKLGDHHIRAGQIPAGGGSQRLPRLVGRQRAMAHLLTGERLDAVRAVEWGLAYRWAPSETFDDLVADVTAQLASRDRAALSKMKELVVEGLKVGLDEGLQIERAAVLDPSSWQDFA